MEKKGNLFERQRVLPAPARGGWSGQLLLLCKQQEPRRLKNPSSHHQQAFGEIKVGSIAAPIRCGFLHIEKEGELRFLLEVQEIPILVRELFNCEQNGIVMIRVG
ncbi:hypothetical protein [Desmospora activa]|uniref:Uncharacterized protein n=1 Tax=Desmospora activa DSM 45169 TaxID=1121389 RepID=A0A2T4Z4H6_9BACL|nr:hypothetical protein [Desmospora activa]PTM56788.1 hypothetical protein C8J48_3113 [Desmospora activa DSM 45169]